MTPTPLTPPKKPLLPVQPHGRAGAGGWTPKHGTVIAISVFIGITTAVVPVLLQPEPKWNVILAAVLGGAATSFGSYLGIRSAGHRAGVLVAFVAASLALSSCATTGGAKQTPLMITGEALDAAGLAFETTAAGMKLASDQHALTQAQVDAWNRFLPRFKASYHLAADLWRAARAHDDQKTVDQVTAILQTLLDELGTFSAAVMSVPPAPAGALEVATPSWVWVVPAEVTR